MLVQNLLTFQSGQAAQLQSQDRVGLDLVDIEQLHQAASRLVDRRRATNQGNNLIQCIQCLEVTVQDVQTLLSLAQAELRAAHNHFDLVGNPVADKAVNRQGSRNTVDQRKHVRREVLLQGGALVEVVQNNLGDRVTLEDNHQTLTGTSRGLITNIRDALDLTVANQLSDLVSEVVGVDLIGQFSDHQALASLDLFDANNGSLSDGAASRTVGILNSTVTQNRCTGWEIGAGNELDQCVKQFFARGLGVVQRPLHTARDFTQVVRGDSRGHTDRNTFRTIH